MIVGSARPRQLAEWLSEIEQTTSTQDLGEAGSAFGCARLQFETLDSKIAEGFMKMLNSKFKDEFQVAVEI